VSKHALVLSCLLVVLPYAARAQPAQEQAVNYYQTLNKAPEQIKAAGMAFGEKMGAVLVQANPENVSQMKGALVDLLLIIGRIKADSKALITFPSPAGKDLTEAVEHYLQQQEKAVTESGPEIIRIASDRALSVGDKRAKIGALAQQNRHAAAAVEAALSRALTVFAREYGLVELHDFIPADGACKVQMPDITENKVQDIGGVKNSFYLYEDKIGVFMLSFADVTASPEDDAAAQKRLDEGRNGLIRKLGMKVTRETALALANKYPGRDLEGDLPDNKTVARIRLFMARGRLYQLWVVGPPSWAAAPEASRFLNSLELLK
jgi:hypothetical protein